MNKKDKSEFRQVLGAFSATCIVIGAIIGIGIFFTPKNVALLTGSANLVMIAWAIGGAIALLGALTFAELGGMYSKTGGQYEILRDAYSAPVGFMYVFCNATAIQAGAIAVIAYYSALNFGVLVQGQPIANWMNVVLATIMIIGLSAANIIGVKWGSAIQNITVVAKVATLLVITGLAIASPTVESVELTVEAAEQLAKTDGVQPWQLVFAGLVPVLFSFGGWQHALWIGGEVRRPKRNVPLAIIVGVTIVTVVYLLANWAYLHLLGFNGVANSQAIAAESVGTVWPEIGPRIVAGAIAFSGFGVLNAQLLSGPRLICGMARDGKFFSPFADLHGKFSTPVAAILLLGGLGLVLIITAGADRVDQILNGVVLVDSVFFLLTGIALIVLRTRRTQTSEVSSSIRIPLFPLAPVLFIIGESLVIIGAFLDPKYRDGAFIGLIWIAAAALCYAIFFRGRTRAAM